LVTVVVTPNLDFCAACNWQGVVTVQAPRHARYPRQLAQAVRAAWGALAGL